jgi:sugar/nucleoside kinase (ribokinase family)
MSDSPLTYLVIGHVCQDHTPFGLKWGGTAMFGAVTAFRLGVQVRVLTSMPSAAVQEALPEGVAVHNIPTDVPLTFLHEYVQGHRVLSITATAPTLHAMHLPPDWQTPDVVHFGPVAQEVGHDLIEAFDASLRGGSVQGWMRSWEASGLVQPLPGAQLLEWAPPVNCSFLSEEDIGDRREVLGFYRRHHPLVALTDGSHGATIFTGESSFHVPAVPTTEVDANGAGDVFAAAFLIRYRETGSALIAAQFAAAVASFHVEQIGIAGLPTRAQAEARYREFYGA